MGMFFHSADAVPERPADPAVRRANLRRIGPLFAPYKRRLGGVLLLIVVSAGLGVIPAFLLKHVLEAIARNDTTALSWNAAGMIAIAIATGVLGVIQTLLSNQVGQRVMHDLRAAVFRHLQRLSLAFFTRTRTGEVQSRVQTGIGAALAAPCGSGSLRLADLEGRQRMAGRWVMASIQTSFAIMPAAVYWFGGLALASGSHAISIATLVAFTTLQTRLFFPVGSLLG